MRYYVLQHVSFETPGYLADMIRERGYSLGTVALYNGEPLPAVGDFDGLIVMGGPMSVHDEAEFPWLAAEKGLIADAIRAGKKVLGICLGAQLIAAACGARVYRSAVKEIGWWPVKGVRAEGGERMEGRAENEMGMVAFHWHGETFDLPAGAELLASTEVCVNQAFRLGEKILGIQFHPEVTGEIIRGMVELEGWELEVAGAPEGRYVQGADEILAGVGKFAAGAWTEWLRDWVGA